MQVKYGGFGFTANSVSVAIDKRYDTTEAGAPWKWTEGWDVEGRLEGSTQAAIRAAIQALENALVPGQDLVLLENDSADSAHIVRDAQTIGGVRVVGVRYPNGRGADYSTYRDFVVRFEFERPYVGYGAGVLLAWQESITFSGGLPRVAWLEPIAGPPRGQVVNQQTAYRAVQQGQAVGAFSRPSPPAPLWPNLVEREVTPANPKRRGNTFVEWPIAWRYAFAGPLPFLGEPTPQPNL